MTKNDKIILVIAALIAAGVALYLWSKKAKATAPPPLEPDPTPTPEPDPTPSGDYCYFHAPGEIYIHYYDQILATIIDKYSGNTLTGVWGQLVYLQYEGHITPSQYDIMLSSLNSIIGG